MNCIICKSETGNKTCLECTQLIAALVYGSSIRQNAWDRLEKRLTGEGGVECG